MPHVFSELSLGFRRRATSTIFWNFDGVERCVKFLVLNLLLEVFPVSCFDITQDTYWQSIGHFPITRSSSSVQTTYVGAVFFQFSSSDTRAPPNFNIPDSSDSVGRSQDWADDGMYPMGRTPSTSLVQCHHHLAQQLLLVTVLTFVVAGSTLCFFAVSLSLSLFVPVLGSGVVVCLQALFA